MRSSENPLPLAIAHRCAVVLSAVLLLAGTSEAHDLGVIGPVYPIAEPSLLDVILERLRALEATGGLAALQRDIQARIARGIEAPEPVAGITRATVARSFHFDPSIEVSYPITDTDGRVLVAPGTRINPLDTVSLTRPLLFIDARDREQVDYARRLLEERGEPLKLILTGGSYMALMRLLKRPVYFDQQGSLTTRLGIRRVPALVTQDGARLRIDEMR